MIKLASAEVVEKLMELSGCSEESVKEYLKVSEEYLDTLETNVEVIDGNEQLDYIYQKANLLPEEIEKISEAELSLFSEK